MDAAKYFLDTLDENAKQRLMEALENIYQEGYTHGVTNSMNRINNLTDDQIRHMPFSPRDSVKMVREWLLAVLKQGL